MKYLFTISRQLKKVILLIIIDIFLVVFTYYFSFYLRLNDLYITEHWRGFVKTLPFVVSSQIVIFYFLGLYKSITRFVNFNTAVRFLKIITIAVILSAITTYFVKAPRLPRSVFIIDWFLLVFFIIGLRFSIRYFYEYLVQKSNKKEAKRLLIYGAGEVGSHLIRELKTNLNLKYNLIGLIDDDNAKIGQTLHEIRVLGNGNDLKKIVEKYKVEEIIIAIPTLSGQELKGILNQVRETGILPKIVPPLNEILSGNKKIGSIKELDIEDIMKRSPKSLDYPEIEKFIAGNTVLVTGAGGSIGMELVNQIASHHPKKIVMIDMNEFNLYSIDKLMNENHQGIKSVPILLDVTNNVKLDKVFVEHKPDFVFHAAAYKHVPMIELNPCAGIVNNIEGTFNVSKASIEHKVKKFILISTDKAVRPTNIMGATKKVCELLVQNICAHETEFVAVRFGNVLGSSGSVIPLMLSQINSGKPVTVTHPDVTRYFMLVSEAVSLVIQAGSIGKGGEVFILDMGKPVKIIDMARELIYLCGKRPDVDVQIKIVGLRPGEKLFEELILNDVEASTKYKDIFIAKKSQVDFSTLDNKISLLLDAAKNENKEQAIKIIKDIVTIYSNEELERETYEKGKSQFKKIKTGDECVK